MNVLCHLVFRDIGIPLHNARFTLSVLLKLDLFRQGINGEAVLWACAGMRGKAPAVALGRRSDRYHRAVNITNAVAERGQVGFGILPRGIRQHS